MFAIAQFISKLFGWDLGKARRAVVISLIVLLGLVLLSLGLLARSCWNNHKLRVSQAQLDKINKANAQERKAELQAVIDQNTDVIKTVDNRTEIVNADVYDRSRAADARVAAADKQIQAAHEQGRDVTQDELECMLVPDNCQK